MRKYIALVLMLLVCLSVMAADSFIKPYAQPTTNQLWWTARKWNKERIEWVDHLGHTNITLRTINGTENERAGSGNGVSIVIAPDLSVVSYTLSHAYIDEGWSIAKVAPGTYDFKVGKWYGDMTDEEKTAMWVAYTNQVAEAKAAHEAMLKAPAKFDVSRTVEEYEAFLLGDRVFEDLTPEEKLEVRRELAKYKDEWTRVNDPENYELHLPDPRHRNGMTEQQKIKSRRRGGYAPR